MSSGKTVNPMTGIEELEFDGVGTLEAFYTSGGASTLPNTLEGKVDFLDYKTIRYPGHCKLFKAMLDIGLASRQPLQVNGQEVYPRAVFRKVLEKNLYYGDLDMTLVRVSLEGLKENKHKRIVYEIVDRQSSPNGLTAMMRTTAFPATIIAIMAAAGELKNIGCLPQEIVVDPALFIPQLRKRGIKLTSHEE